jgi:hypothetical protein
VAASPTNPILTVAVPTYNGARHLAQALQSILAQQGVAFQLLVADDRSDDETLEVVRVTAGDRARIEVSSERIGLAGNWNRSVALASTPLVAIFHQDDVMLAGHLQAHEEALRSDESVGLAASAAVVIDEHGGPISPSVVNPGGLGDLDRVLNAGALAAEMASGNPFRCSGVTVRAATHRDLGGFDGSLRYVVDWDFWLRVSRKWRVAWLARPTVQVRWHSGSETHRLKTGIDDLDETEWLLKQLLEIDWKARPDISALARAANAQLGRGFLNRALDALHSGEPALARGALRQGLSRSPAVLWALVGDPRLLIQMAALLAAPRLAARLFSGDSSPGSSGPGQGQARTR